jgi:hypothetical protein
MWLLPESNDHWVIEGNEMLHFNSQKELASHSILLELFSVDVGILNLALPDEVDEFVFS